MSGQKSGHSIKLKNYLDTNTMTIFNQLDQAIEEFDSITNNFIGKMKIKQFRKLHKLSQRQLSSLLKVNVRTIQRWESGDRTPHPMVYELLEKLDMPVKDK